QLADPLELGEVLLDPGVGKLGQNLGPQRLERRAQLAHDRPSNMGSTLRSGPAQNRDDDHGSGQVDRRSSGFGAASAQRSKRSMEIKEIPRDRRPKRGGGPNEAAAQTRRRPKRGGGPNEAAAQTRRRPKR